MTSLIFYFFFTVSKKDQNYEATKLHFENLVKRYGNPIILLNLIRVSFFNFWGTKVVFSYLHSLLSMVISHILY